jgi:hypothetical protein
MKPMTNWIFLSKDGQDEYINMFALGANGRVINTDDFVYEHSRDPIVLRGILKKKIMQRCWFDNRDFYFMDTGYLGNQKSALNPMGWKYWHRIVKNDIQHGNTIIERPDDRFRKLGIPIHSWKKGGRKILIAAPDEKPCKFYNIDLEEWINDTIYTLKQYTDREIVVRQRVKSRSDRILTNTLKEALDDDVHALVTYNSNSATEAILYGYPAFTLAPTHAASPVSSQDLSQIETPYYPDKDKVYAWACHLAYGQYHIDELKNGAAWRMLNEF